MGSSIINICCFLCCVLLFPKLYFDLLLMLEYLLGGIFFDHMASQDVTSSNIGLYRPHLRGINLQVGDHHNLKLLVLLLSVDLDINID